MRSILRSLTFGLAATLAGAAVAQQPYTVVMDGFIIGCYTGQMVTIETNSNTQPYQNFAVAVDPNTCMWSATLNVASNPASFTATTLCNGLVVTANGTAQFNFIQDSVFVTMTLDCGTSNPIDCNGMINGPAQPGTPCDDGDPMTTGDVWSISCVCAGVDTSYYDCLQIENGPNLPGTFCEDNDNNPNTQGVWNSACICTPDSNGFYYDCLGVLNGLSGPGTICTYTDDSVTYVSGVFNWACVCVNDSNNFYDCSGDLGGAAFIDACGVCAGGNTGITPNTICADCMGIPNGPNLPFTTCDDNNPDTFDDQWNIACICTGLPDTTLTDCLGDPNGNAWPGTACTVPGTILEGTWNSACVCVANNPNPCQADFWVVQAMGSDSLPVPYELWVWNLSSGGSGNFTFNWNFGDGTSSTEPFPTHTYDGNGPYVLCLTIVDNNACTSVHCDSISINGDGIYEGMIVHAEDRQDGFTINMQDANAVQEIVANNNIAVWPNPVVDELNVAVVSGMKGNVTVTITDLDGRTVKTERTSLGGGRSQLRIATSGLNAGLYMLRVTDGNTNLSQRFVKTN